MNRYFVERLLICALTISLGVLSTHASDDDFDFAEFFNSLLEDESLGLKEHAQAAPPPPAPRGLTKPSTAAPETKALEQTISPNKKGNFLSALRFEPAKKDGPKPRVKVPVQKREAFLYYNQKLINLLDALRSNLDISMRSELSDFMSVSDSIIERILAIDRQYLLRTFYHKDFDDLRKKIYEELTKKSSKKSLRSVNIEFAKIKDKAAAKNDDDDEEELTFTVRTKIPLKQRQKLIKDIRELTTQKLKPIADGLAKITGHKQAVDEKNKKIATMREREKLRPKATSRTPWRPSFGGGGRGGRGGRSSGYNGSRSGYPGGGGGYYGGGSGYRPSWNDRDKDNFGQKTSDTPSSGSSSAYPTKEKKKDEERIPEVFAKIKNLLEGSGKPLTDMVNALAQTPTSKDIGSYLFDKKLGGFLAHPNLPEYMNMIHEIDRELMAYDTSSDITESMKKEKEGGTKAGSKSTASPAKRTPSELETRLRKNYAAFRQKALVALSRAENAFCITKNDLMPNISPANPFLPTAIFAESADLPDNRALYQAVKQARAHLASSYPKQAEQLEKTLTNFCKKYDQETLHEFSALVEFCRKYRDEFNTHAAEYQRTKRNLRNGIISAADAETELARHKRALQDLISDYPIIRKVLTVYDVYPHFVEIEPSDPPTLANINEILDLQSRISNLSWKTIARSAKRLLREYPTKTIADITPQLQIRARTFVDAYDDGLITTMRDDANLQDGMMDALNVMIDDLTAAHQDTTPALQARERLAHVRADLERDGKAAIESAWKLVAPAAPADHVVPPEDPDA